LATPILPVVRNAAAHEYYTWDDRRKALLVGEESVTADELENATNLAYSLIIGAESALRCSRTEFPNLAELLDQDDPPAGLRTMNERSALDHFGMNGLSVRSWTHEDGVFSVVLDSLPRSLVNPGLQALMRASRYLTHDERFRIIVHGMDSVAVDIDRTTLDLTFKVWIKAVSYFRVMPTKDPAAFPQVGGRSAALPEVGRSVFQCVPR
jgi:hypothetical protein